MNGSFKDVTIVIRPIEEADGTGSEWALQASLVTYQIEAGDIIVLRITSRHKAVKTECDEDAPAEPSGSAANPPADSSGSTAKPPADPSGSAANPLAVGVAQLPANALSAIREEAGDAAASRPPHTPRRTKRRRCNVHECTRFAQRNVVQSDAHGPIGPRCTRHGGGPPRRDAPTVRTESTEGPSGHPRSTDGAPSARALVPRSITDTSSGASGSKKRARCNVDSCARFSQRRVTEEDAHGPSGPRCSNHGGRVLRSGSRSDGGSGRAHPQCNVVDCNRYSQGKVADADNDGPAGKRCVRHGCVVHHSRCNVAGCTRFSQGKVVKTDNFGTPGRRCNCHGGGTRCIVPNCTSAGQRVVPADDNGPAGRRCIRHGGRTKCGIEECPNYAQRAQDPPRCIQHGGKPAGDAGPRARCDVEGCARFSQRKVVDKDEFGPAGKRCVKHGGGALRCTASGCMSRARGKVDVADEHGQEGARCPLHNGSTTAG
eukprot:GEMP01037655.1.p1 GENE.GEMP01037655.1~~GEMP01037655.1.p1  ORF type:complete len:486 (+),score=115.73 GEMP01037655.1:55-1512(+)